jgi:hypothetical protein
LQVGDVVVLSSGYTPAANGIPSPVVRLFVTTTREPNRCGCEECVHAAWSFRGDPSWTSPVAVAEVRVGGKLVETSAELGVFAVAPSSRRGLIARMRRDASRQKTTPRNGVGSVRGVATSSAGSERPRSRKDRDA